MPVVTRIRDVLAGNLVPFGLATIVLAGRIYARAAVLRKIGVDDYLLTLGWLCALVNCILAVLATKYGLATHQQEVPLALIPTFRKLTFATYITYQFSLGFTKLAISVLYLHALGISKSACREVYALIAFVFVYTIALTVQLVFSCVPIRKTWHSEVAGYCYSLEPGFWAHFVCNLVSDIWLIAFAAPRVWRIKLPTRQKVVLLATITLGWVVVIAAIVRAVLVSMVINAVDRTWASRDPSIWTSVELNVAILCAAVPALKPLLTRFVPDTVTPRSNLYLHSIPSLVSSDTRSDG
ncbi:hypothetical protein LTR95_001039 [Oleoguttula sp. CCFEE 5521]